MLYLKNSTITVANFNCKEVNYLNSNLSMEKSKNHEGDSFPQSTWE